MIAPKVATPAAMPEIAPPTVPVTKPTPAPTIAPMTAPFPPPRTAPTPVPIPTEITENNLARSRTVDKLAVGIVQESIGYNAVFIGYCDSTASPVFSIAYLGRFCKYPKLKTPRLRSAEKILA